MVNERQDEDRRNDNRLADAVRLLASEIHELRHDRSHVILDRLTQMENKIMATQAELTADLKLVKAQQVKTAEEIAAVQAAQNLSLQKITDLEAVIAAGVTPSQELVDAVAEVKAQAQIVDELIPDLPVVIPPTEPTV
jgi:Xaa-Pro aminopeptidase